MLFKMQGCSTCSLYEEGRLKGGFALSISSKQQVFGKQEIPMESVSFSELQGVSSYIFDTRQIKSNQIETNYSPFCQRGTIVAFCLVEFEISSEVKFSHCQVNICPH